MRFINPRELSHAHKVCSIFLAIVVFFSAASPALGIGRFTYQVLYDQNSSATPAAATAPSLNDAGVVAFLGRVGSNDAIVRGNGGPITTIAIQGTTYSSFSPYTDINNAGLVRFNAARTTGDQGVFVGNGITSPTNINGSTTGNFTTDLGVPSINGLGQVSFNAFSGSAPGLYVGSGGVPTLVGFAGSTSDINNAGTVTWSIGGQVLRWSNGITTTVDSTGGVFNGLPTSPGINAFGTIAYAGFLDAGGMALAVNSGGMSTIIASTGSGFTSIGLEVGINDVGTVVFPGGAPGMTQGVFVGPDPVNDVVFYQGMPLFGSTLGSFSFYRNGFNNLGQIAFAYSLANGGQGIALATPIPVPEPATLILVLLGVPIMCAMRKQCCSANRARKIRSM